MPLCYAAPVVPYTAADTTNTVTIADTTVVHTERTFKEGFQENYKGNEFQYETKPKPKSAWDRFWEGVGNFLRDLFGSGEGEKGSPFWGLFFKLLALVVVIFAIYMIVRAIIGKDSMWIFSKSHKKIAVQDISEEDLQQMDFPTLINQTKETGDYRLAVRYYYLWLLKKLAAREIIKWNWDKTNSDYGYEIKDDTLRGEYNYLAYVYDYSWYGEFTLDEKAFGKAEKAFLKTINTL